VRCAVEVQGAVAERHAEIAAGERIEWRIGINLGDVIAEAENIYGDGVNLAARLEGLAEPGAVFVSNTVHDQVRDRLPFSFEDLGEKRVKNITRPVRVYRVRPAGEADTAIAPAPPLPDKPSIAVLPFANLSGDPEQEYFADGMVEEIITALSRIRWLFVIARYSSFTYKGQAVDVKQVGRELGVRYLLEGSVRKAGGRVRITAQLVGAQTGAHLWADRFDGSLEDVFDLQDQVAISVAGVIEPALEAAETRLARARPTSDLTAYDLYLRANELFPAWSKEPTLHALELLERAIERDPRYGIALALAGVFHSLIFCSGWADDPDATRRQGIAFPKGIAGRRRRSDSPRLGLAGADRFRPGCRADHRPDRPGAGAQPRLCLGLAGQRLGSSGRRRRRPGDRGFCHRRPARPALAFPSVHSDRDRHRPFPGAPARSGGGVARVDAAVAFLRDALLLSHHLLRPSGPARRRAPRVPAADDPHPIAPEAACATSKISASVGLPRSPNSGIASARASS
jgi:TolB-like protein